MRWRGTGAVLLIAILALSSAGCGSSDKTTAESGETKKSKAHFSSLSESPGIPDGIWKLGADYEPVLYRAPGGKDCRWAALKTSQPGGGIIEKGGAANTQTLQITSPYFETHDCGEWSSDYGSWGPLKSTISDGIWKQLVDYLPALYRAPGGKDCHWEALGSAHPTTDVFEQGGGSHTLKVKIISPYFATEGCGQWKKIGSYRP